MKTIWKYETPRDELDDEIIHQMPRDAVVISVTNLGEKLTIYAVVDPGAGKVARRFRVAGTGHPLSEDVESFGHVGTAAFINGAFVLHVFDMGED